MTKKQKNRLAGILCASALFLIGLFFSGWVRFGFMLAAWVITGWRVAKNAVLSLIHGGVFDECFLMTVATVGAFVLGDYPEGAAVMIFFGIGELFESLAVEQSRKSIAALTELRADSAFVYRQGALVEMEPEEVAAGDVLLVKPGQRIPVDGIILEGSASLDTAQITGESMPKDVGCGEQVLSGCINLSGVLKIQAQSAYEHSTVARILELIETASETKAPTERMITRFARIYTPVVVGSALLLAVVPSLIFGNWAQWIERALSFLVISCPCALVISVPLSFFGGMGAASKQGIIIKGGAVMEQLAKAEIAAFDKTGTLTKGQFRVTELVGNRELPEKIIGLAAGAESMSTHPIAAAIRKAAVRVPADAQVLSETPGLGVIAQVEGHRVLAGSRMLLQREGIAVDMGQPGTCVYLAVDGSFAGIICLEDLPKENAAKALQSLKSLGIRQLVLLTGDNAQAAGRMAELLPLDRIESGLLPQDKAAEMEKLLSQRQKGTVVYTGDGVNDAPVLTLADVGVAMGGVGSDAAVEAADVVILNDDLEKLPSAIRISNRTIQIAKQNIIFALAVKLAVLLLAAFGAASMWMAVFADVGVSVLAITNAMRALRMKE